MVHTGIHVLLLEDNPGDVRLIREMILSNPGHWVHLEHVDSLRGGLQRLTEHEFDVILLDLSLPDSHGIDTLLRLSEAAPDIAIVVLTGNNDEDLGLQALQMGAQDYLPKSDVDAKLLTRALRYAVERHRIDTLIRQNEQEYRSLIDDVFDTSMVAVLILNKELRVVWCNEATEIYFGISRKNLLGKDSRIVIDGELKCIFADPDGYASHLLQAYATSSFTDRFECHVLDEGGRQERWLEHWSQPIRQGMYAGGRIEQYTDITERKWLEIAEEEQRKFSEVLRDIATILTSTLDLNEVLGRMLDTLGRIVPHDSASVIMLEEDHLWVARQQHDPRRDTQELVAENQMQYESAYLEELFADGSPVTLADLQEKPEMRSSAERAHLHSYVGAPIRLQNKTIGFVNLFSQEKGFFTQHHAERLMAFAELAAIAIQNARLYQQSQALAAVEERHRIARDLHDSVSQTLFTCRTIAESALRRWEKDPARAYALTQEVYQLTVTALAEMRILLLELRPDSLNQVTLKQLFEQYLQPIQDRASFKLTLAIDDVPMLPSEKQIALYRIVQEALNNIDKHSRATEVSVSVRQLVDCIELQIHDDGEGFDMSSIRTTSLGLSIMRERAESIGATLQIDTEIGVGTSIKVIWQQQ